MAFQTKLIPRKGATHGETIVQTPRTNITQNSERVDLIILLDNLISLSDFVVYNALKIGVRRGAFN